MPTIEGHDVLAGLMRYLSDRDAENAVACAARLRDVLPEPDLDRNVVLVAYGGGKDSSFSVAFARIMQLLLLRDHGHTFRLRAVTNRHGGMPQAVMDNIDRVYRAMGLYDDPRCETLLVDGREVTDFRVDAPQHTSVLARNRLDILLTGHRTFADGRPTFCNACNLSMVNAFGIAAAHDGGVHVIITGDSPEEQRAYSLWVSRLALRYGGRAPRRSDRGFRAFLEQVDDISHAYFADIHGSGARRALAGRAVESAVPRGLQFFSIYDETRYASGDHWSLLTDYLGFEFDELAFSFTESDCANPALMAHLRGLKCERLFGRGYAEGLSEYVGFAVRLMRQKEFPQALIDRMTERYAGPDAAARLRRQVNDFAYRAYRLTEEQLICMVYSPFTERGSGLDGYLAREQPGFADSAEEVHALLCQAEPPTRYDHAVRWMLERASGLTLAELRTLYQAPLRSGQPAGGARSIIADVLSGDPHKGVVSTRHEPHGPVVRELISGR